MDISAADFKELLSLKKDVHIIDVREELEYNTFNIGGKNMPLNDLLTNLSGIGIDKSAEIVVICQHGLRSKTASMQLKQDGFHKVKNLKGGLISYTRLMNNQTL